MKIYDELWKPKFSVGIKQFDDHHKQLYAIIATFKQKVQENDKTFLKKILFDLISYTKYHFKAEERVMSLYKYTDYENHLAEHQEFTKLLEAFIKKYSQGDRVQLQQILKFLIEWWANHILKSDMKYSKYLQARGVR